VRQSGSTRSRREGDLEGQRQQKVGPHLGGGTTACGCSSSASANCITMQCWGAQAGRTISRAFRTEFLFVPCCILYTQVNHEPCCVSLFRGSGCVWVSRIQPKIVVLHPPGCCGIPPRAAPSICPLLSPSSRDSFEGGRWRKGEAFLHHERGGAGSSQSRVLLNRPFRGI